MEVTGITTMNQLAILVEALGHSTGFEDEYTDQYANQQLALQAQTIAKTLCRLHDLIQFAARM